jgi:predicted RNA-binding protein YlxR (DUF448 family)
MVEPAADGNADRGRRGVAAATSRLCIATREVRPVEEMIRFVADPNGTVVPDLKRRLPGRGVWVTARRRLVEEAVKRRAFGRGLKGNVNAPADLPAALDRLLERSVLDALSMAYKAGLVVLGFARVEAALASGQVVALIKARDAGADGARKLARIEQGSPRAVNVEVFTTDQLDLAVGRLNVVHAALLAGRASETFLARWRILELFRADEGDDVRSRRPNDNALEPGP